MKTLTDAWGWYEATRRNLQRMRRLGRRHWDDLPWQTGSIGRDEQLRTLEASDIEAETTAGLKPIDDLAIVVLFSVFESRVRDFLVARIKPEAADLADPILKEAADDAIQGVEEGSFFRRVLHPLKEQGRVSADLITQVDQMRNYRNWVAHGRRDRATGTSYVTPRMAYERLKELLAVLDIAAEAERVEPEGPDEGPE